MPVELVNQPRCGVCGRIKGETNRWFLVRVLGPELTYRDYNPEFLTEYDEAICGMACLDERHHAHAQKLIGMRTVGEPYLDQQD